MQTLNEQAGAGCAGVLIGFLGIFVVGPLFGLLMAQVGSGGPAAGYRWMFVVWALSVVWGVVLVTRQTPNGPSA